MRKIILASGYASEEGILELASVPFEIVVSEVEKQLVHIHRLLIL